MSSDIKLDFLSPTTFDFQIVNNDLAIEDGLKTAIIISLFSDRRVSEEELPIGERERRGYWPDALNDDGDLIGSKLWLLERQAITSELLILFQKYCEEALQWFVDDKIAERVVVTVERSGNFQVSIEIEIYRPHDSSISRQFSFVWESVANAV